MASFCQYGEIFSGFIKGCKVLGDQLNECTLLKKETALLRQSPSIYALLSAQLIINLALWILLLINCELTFVFLVFVIIIYSPHGHHKLISVSVYSGKIRSDIPSFSMQLAQNRNKINQNFPLFC